MRVGGEAGWVIELVERGREGKGHSQPLRFVVVQSAGSQWSGEARVQIGVHDKCSKQ